MSVLERIACHNFVTVDGNAYFSSRYYNGFFKVETESGDTFFEGYFEDEKISQRNIHKEIFLRDKKVYMCPWKGSHIHIWDLENSSLHSVKIRAEDEAPFWVEEVILGEKYVFLMTDCKANPGIKMDLETLGVRKVHDRSEIKGIFLSEFKDRFPVPELIEKYQIEYADMISWKRVSDKKWCGFCPLSHHLLIYEEGSDGLEIRTLNVINKKALDGHLHKIRMELLYENAVFEAVIRFQDFLEEIKAGETDMTEKPGTVGDIGKEIWKHIR